VRELKLSPDFRRIVRRPELGWIGGAGNDVESGLRHVVGDEHASLHEFAQHRDPFTPPHDSPLTPSAEAGVERASQAFQCGPPRRRPGQVLLVRQGEAGVDPAAGPCSTPENGAQSRQGLVDDHRIRRPREASPIKGLE
jgi:hypothetical protein